MGRVKQAAAPSPPRRLRADAARNQQRIVAAARELFADHGLEITLDDVAERAGVGVGTVYRRFANKRELIAEVFEQNMRDFAVAAEQAAAHEDPWLGLVEFFEYACRHLADNRGFSEVMLELHDDPDHFTQFRDRIKPTIAAVVDRARAAGMLQPEIEASDFFALVHMIDAIADFAKPANPEVWQRYAAIALNGVRAGAAPRMPLTVRAMTEDEIERAKDHSCVGRRR
ncbi:TetR/AcrR family transcriptional regulator [Nocardia farcinica]|uniref:HTH-type transcriptional repressor Bm3R1 n=2 Tax=Nocardia farcinica TaxID=37329 RepID=A0A0H5P7T3_NOCFR|nr:TetR/AcrR family transcriptional regulator [Nocardia farcinica]MBF6248466.1 TetR/AcrR family transcriptional regulator [Nocardia elegans]PEH77238.1 TetR family transcriptional regulator [Nocardia sp. FDAARGOS_372]BAD59307.1 putative transcriptional regulator [Nocardia farcinica IFM 10152]MBA4854774.1 TetR/AcrR family transcriptional regulator [Nocardia farcinica]